MSNKSGTLTVLYISTDATMGGSTASLLNMLKSLKPHVTPIVLFPYDGIAVDLFRKQGIECYIVPFTVLYLLKHNLFKSVWLHPWNWSPVRRFITDFSCIVRMKYYLRNRQISIVHSNTSPSVVGIGLAKVFRAKHIWHIREFLDLDFDFDIFGGIDSLKRKINKADARIVISKAIANHWGFSEKATYVVNNAIRSRNDCSLVSDKEKNILFISYVLTEKKGAVFAIQAFSKSGLAKSGYKLLMIGNISESPDAAVINKAISDSGAENNIELIPVQDNVKPYFEKASAFLMTSNFEGLGRVTAEAMFYGCPVVARAAGGTLDIVIDRKTGYLFNTLDECSDRLVEVCSNSQLEIIRNAQSFAVNNLSEEVYGPKILDIYRQILSK